MTDPLKDRSIILGVTGSIAAYKALSVTSRLIQAGAAVDVILTRAACELVTPLSFQALTHRPVVSDMWRPTGPMALDHVTMGRAAELLLVAPITADTIARLALGRADDALAATALAARAPMLLAPAMEPRMWSHPATQHNVAALVARGATAIGPDAGRMASGESGIGRLAAPERIVDGARWLLSRAGPWAGRHVLVTAGPTREPIDPVRYLSNHSSGKMGLALATAARNRGAAVTMVRGPIDMPEIAGVTVVTVETAEQMRDRVVALLAQVHAVVMAAAVADYRPAEPAGRKIKKTDQDSVLTLTRTPDILLELRSAARALVPPPVLVGFAAETDELVANARAKLRAKGLDLIVANAVPQSFGADEASVILVDDTSAIEIADRAKGEIAEAVFDRVEALWQRAEPDARSTGALPAGHGTLRGLEP
jgi:phosphopantothenoylcysteine decarboxylase / phosphopantothenate---cysteine ligase